jgi:UDP-N-acetylglucosamine 2-epimerase (non-hydrolysing)
MTSTRIMLCMGTRPEIIKMAPVHEALRGPAAGARSTIVLHTGQHDEMAMPLYRFFDMPPAITLVPRSRGASLAHPTASMLEQAAEAIDTARPDLVLVQGDTTSALCCALAAFYARVPVGHVEAGLRTYAEDPFPEEKNRELIGRIAHWHFTPTPQGSENLHRERVGGAVHCVGNTIVDAVQLGLRRLGQTALTRIDPDDRAAADVAEFLAAQRGRRLILVTAHRRENWGAPMRDIARAVAQLARQRDDLAWVWPLHQNPDVRATIRAELDPLAAQLADRMLLTPPLNYPALLAVLAQAHLILTDSGGIQEEAATLRRPVIVLRESTERQELIDAGGGVLAGTDTQRIVAAATRLLDDPAAYAAMRVRTNPFGDGHSAERIVDVLER